MSGNEKITVESMNLYYGKFHALKNINMAIPYVFLPRWAAVWAAGSVHQHWTDWCVI